MNPRSFVVGDFKFDTDADWERGTKADIAAVIDKGANVFGGSSLMPGWGGTLSSSEIADLVTYIQSLKE
ncbi:MAG: cytochrome c [Halieaceae bacterium]|nr:cytochrome c [Halieaceae bacterium]